LRLSRPRVETRNDHGTGCTLSAAIAAGLARRQTLQDAVVAAKTYLHEALVAGAALKIGQGRGPVHHFHRWWSASGISSVPEPCAGFTVQVSL
jgi:hydroxymethylpyrimidine/phosphomethylpyrimidine kinase